MTDDTYADAVDETKRAFIEAERKLEMAMRIYEERKKDYEIASVAHSLAMALGWQAKVEEARGALHKAVRDEALARGRL